MSSRQKGLGNSSNLALLTLTHVHLSTPIVIYIYIYIQTLYALQLLTHCTILAVQSCLDCNWILSQCLQINFNGASFISVRLFLSFSFFCCCNASLVSLQFVPILMFSENFPLITTVLHLFQPAERQETTGTLMTCRM